MRADQGGGVNSTRASNRESEGSKSERGADCGAHGGGESPRSNAHHVQKRALMAALRARACAGAGGAQRRRRLAAVPLAAYCCSTFRIVQGALVRCSAAGGGGDARRKRVYGWRGGAASLRGADTAQVCSNVGLVVPDGAFECSCAVPARQGVSGRLRARLFRCHHIVTRHTSHVTCFSMFVTASGCG